MYFLQSLQSDNRFHSNKSGKGIKYQMDNIFHLLTKSSKWMDVKILDCSIPRYGILSATHNTTEINCRFAFSSGAVVRNNDVVNCLFDAQPICKITIFSVFKSFNFVPTLKFCK